MKNKSFAIMCMWSAIVAVLICLAGILTEVIKQRINPGMSIFLGIFLVLYLVAGQIGGVISGIYVYAVRAPRLSRVINFFGVENILLGLGIIIIEFTGQGFSKNIYLSALLSVIIGVLILYRQRRVSQTSQV